MENSELSDLVRWLSEKSGTKNGRALEYLDEEAKQYLWKKSAELTEKQLDDILDDIIKEVEELEEATGVIENVGRKSVVKKVEEITKSTVEKAPKIQPSMAEGSQPFGNYAEETKSAYIRQNEAADLMASKGYKVEMLDELREGNGYGIKAGANPDYLIEGKVFDCYAPDTGSIKNVIRKMRAKTKEQTTNLILNLDDYLGDMEELIQTILRMANPDGDLKYLEELYVIKDGKIMDIFE